MSPVRLLPAVAAMCVAAVLTGCTSADPAAHPPTHAPTSTSASPRATGVAGLTAREVMRQARTALARARSVRVIADVVDSGERIVMDARVRGNEGATGSFRVRAATLRFLRIGQKVYLHADAASWRKLGADPTGAALLAGKWVLTPTSDPDVADLMKVTTIRWLAAQLSPADAPRTKGPWPPDTVRGRPAVRLGDSEATLYVAASGPPYPLRLVYKGPDSGTIDFADYNRSVILTEPPAAQIITMPGS